MVLSPVSAMRAWGALSRDLFAAHYPLAVASVLCSRPTVESFARVILRDVHHPIVPTCPSDDPASRLADPGSAPGSPRPCGAWCSTSASTPTT